VALPSASAVADHVDPATESFATVPSNTPVTEYFSGTPVKPTAGVSISIADEESGRIAKQLATRNCRIRLRETSLLLLM
jgi:hypothetical protein